MPKPTPAPKAKPAAPVTDSKKATATVVVKGQKIPKSLAECADLLFTTKALRLAKEKEAENLKSMETALKEHLIQNLPKSQASGIAGKLARVTIGTKTVPIAKDWDKLNAYILKEGKKNPGVFSLYQRRLGEATIKEMWEAGKAVPGVEAFDLPTVSINKL